MKQLKWKENKMDDKQIYEIIHKVLDELTDNTIKNKALEFEKKVDESGVLCVKTDTVKPEPFDTGKSGDKVFLKDIVTLNESPRLGAGVMEMEHTTFDWTLGYDEFDYIIEGTLCININGRSIVGNKGDVIFIPKGSSIQFSAPQFARFVYITYPADWQ
ncbi:ethanolamine utilization protein [Eubacterium limosum]|jgi:ethanolamine utilization protein EutQ|uniref:Ethanolamine utilization protein n=2 Tax=Eubacterium limosum TaxID=1736 RepID=A0AAC9QVJ6_EUBLI|nr:ethanolamine utilization protein [Eubacterium limosum]